LSAVGADEDTLLAFLGEGRAHGRPDETVERISTHAAHVFLIGELAYKFKRPVRYSFLDFRTLAARHRALQAELRLNRRTAPMIYQRLVPVTRGQRGNLAIEGDGEVVEWLLEMRRFDQAALLDRVGQRGELSDAIVDRLARVVADFHERAEAGPEFGGYAAMRTVIEGNTHDLESLAGGLFDASAIGSLNAATRRALERGRDLLEQRRASGRVRHCHGDLHLRNIVLLEGEPVLFDCLEFDEGLATIDTFYDLAFLLMDLEHRGLGGHAARLLAGYLDATWDDGGTALLPLFLSCRAAIRAKISGFEADSSAPAADRQSRRAEAIDYLERARAYLEPDPPSLLAIGGLSGTGKSTLAHLLAPRIGARPGAVVLKSDATRKRLFEVAPETRLGAEAYRKEVSSRVYRRLAERASALLADGHAAIVDAVFLDPAERAEIEAVAQDAGVPFRGLWLRAPPATLQRRVEGRTGDVSDATSDVVRLQLGADPGSIGWTPLDADADPNLVVAGAARALGLADPVTARFS
jgi:aminoglycoside phosphotransferase family enzyme/predicted kinase